MNKHRAERQKRNSKGTYEARDLTGLVVNECEALYPTDERKSTYVVWVIRCLLCGETFQRGAYALTRGTVKHRCKAYYAKYGPDSSGRPPIEDNGAHVNALYRAIQRRAKVRGIAFDLTKEEARALFEGDCAYCGVAPALRNTHGHLAGTYEANGIDRVDSAKGYSADNCVSACKDCNLAKGVKSVDEFKRWLARAYRHLL